MTPEEFRKEGRRLIDWIADYRAGIAGRPVMAAVKPGEIRSSLPKSPPENPEPFDAIFADIDRLVAPGNAAALARAIGAAIENPAASFDQASALRARIAEKFSAAAMVDSILGAYQQARLPSAAPLSLASKRAI